MKFSGGSTSVTSARDPGFEENRISASSTKHYNIGDPIDKAAFKVELVLENDKTYPITDFNVSLNEETASLTSKATITYGEYKDVVAIPLNKVLIQAEDCTNTTDNYRLYAKEGTYKIEEGHGENKTASFGLNSIARKSTSNVGINTELTFTIDSGCEQEIGFYMNAASTVRLSNKKMTDVLVEDALDMKVNGENASFLPDAVVLGEQSSDWFNWKYLKIASLNLKKGINTIEIIVNCKDTILVGQEGGDGPFNVDYFVFEHENN